MPVFLSPTWPRHRSPALGRGADPLAVRISPLPPPSAFSRRPSYWRVLLEVPVSVRAPGFVPLWRPRPL